MEIHGFEASKFVAEEARKQKAAHERMDSVDTPGLVHIVANHEGNPVVRLAKTVLREWKHDDYGTPEFLQSNPADYIPTSREDYQARQILVERLGR